MLKEIKARARFMDPIQHNEKLTHFTGVRTDWFIEGILFNNADCEYDVGDDITFTMHNIEFSDGSECYFEVLADGALTHFMATAFIELRDGLLVVSPKTVFEESKKRRDEDDRVAEPARKGGRRVRDIEVEEEEDS